MSNDMRKLMKITESYMDDPNRPGSKDASGVWNKYEDCPTCNGWGEYIPPGAEQDLDNVVACPDCADDLGPAAQGKSKIVKQMGDEADAGWTVKDFPLSENEEPECPYCDDEEPLDGVACLNCGSKQFVGEAGDPDDTDWDAHWAREDGDDERADDLEADAEFARMDDELDEDSDEGCVCKGKGFLYGDHGTFDCPRCGKDDERKLQDKVADAELGEAKDGECTRCFGLGRHPGRGGEDCPECKGTGECPKVEEDLDPDGMGHYEVVVRRGTLSGGDNNVHEDVVSGPLPLDQARNVARSHVRQIRSESETGSKVKKGYLPTQESWAIRFNSHRAGESAGAFVFIRQAEDADVEAWFGEDINLESIVESVLEAFPGQPKDYEMSDDEYDPYDEADQREMADDMDKDYSQDTIDPEIEDEELGLRFD